MTARRSQLAGRRQQRGFSQERLAELLGVSRGTVARWERGEGEMFARQRVGLAEALEVTLPELDRLLVRDGSPMGLQTSPTDEPVDLKQLTLGLLVDFRLRDSQVGGGALYEEVVGFLSGTLGPHCFGVFDSGRAAVFAAAACVTEMAGWMAYEAGRPDVAERHFGRAHDLAALGGDSQLSAHILASRSHLAAETGSARRAGTLARSGLGELSTGPPAPDLEAKLLMYEARSAGRAGEVGRCQDLMEEAEIGLATATGQVISPWLSPFDGASLANEMARCHLLIGDYSEAARQARAVLDERPPDRVRSRVFGHIAWARAHAALGDLDEARSVTVSATEEAALLRSAPIDRELSALAGALGLPQER